ncbi:unnamed protein product (macronuclear) [Paramecium tetraurelia]|uniref:Chromosome undetermined scaffold_286, whole genome shotgun sequence n=1 Tax=Paramecium tetraurelia TaxID=5888 RepID=A0CUV6_PARTE|nr:uncharacterized protein GSPATT00039028001 [Paramecium tetraurelia]XP_001462524.1 uncharacterized protein GSPATT00027480001 [Paramecium tetraurelia]CAK74573.1 unnamed protein product [Paramecium tetraurelia]CAK95151.1 unnamed protein product [Paramecium tetraurelia]|eukprot:XP_001441970.1 hypothetical protein (macronuclear) [Paramecium tetraurelia strain d4-2]
MQRIIKQFSVLFIWIVSCEQNALLTFSYLRASVIESLVKEHYDYGLQKRDNDPESEIALHHNGFKLEYLIRYSQFESNQEFVWLLQCMDECLRGFLIQI